MSSTENRPSSAASRHLHISGSADRAMRKCLGGETASGARRSETGLTRRGEGTRFLVPSDTSER
jgi:hypothetical protein